MMNEVEVQEKKNNNKKIIFIVITVLVLILGCMGFYAWKKADDGKSDTNKVEKKKEKKEKEQEQEDEDPGYIDDDEDDDKPVVIPEWGNKYYDYIIKTFANDKNSIEGYFIDFAKDNVPELVLFEYDENDNCLTSILYIDNGVIKQTRKYEEAYMVLLYNIKTDSLDKWYVFAYDEDFNDLYIDVLYLIGNSTTNNSFKITNDTEKQKLRDTYLEIPFDLEKYDLNKDFDKEVLKDLVKQFYKEKIPSDDVMVFIRESLGIGND